MYMETTSKVLEKIAAGKTPEEIEREAKLKRRASMLARIEANRANIADTGKLYTLDEMLEFWHEERATGEGLEKLWGIKPTSTRA